MSKPKGDIKAPNFSKDYEKGIQIAMKYLPQQLQQEFAMRQQYDPKYIQQALELQHAYDPFLADEQLHALYRRDPHWMTMHQELGDKISKMLRQGYMDPRQEAAYQQYSQLAGKGEPTRDKAYQALGQQVTGDTLRGTTADPATLRQMTQAILSRQPSLSYGEAQDMAAAVYTGQRGQALQQQRQQATGAFLQTATPTAQREASLAQFYGMAPPEAQTLAQAGSYLSSPSQSQMINQIQGVTPPSANRYVNPNAGYQGAQYGLQNYQNLLAQQQTQGSGNPWMNALQGAGTGASYGSYGGGYGAAGGAITGAVAGAFGYPQYSDARLKINTSRTGAVTKDGIPIVTFSFKDTDKRYRGVIAQDVQKVRPDAVFKMGEYLMVEYHKLGIKLEEEVQ